MIESIVLDLEKRLKGQGKPGKTISREKMRYREKLGRLSFEEVAFLANAIERKRENDNTRG
jgi:hypothetical protein